MAQQIHNLKKQLLGTSSQKVKKDINDISKLIFFWYIFDTNVKCIFHIQYIFLYIFQYTIYLRMAYNFVYII